MDDVIMLMLMHATARMWARQNPTFQKLKTTLAKQLSRIDCHIRADIHFLSHTISRGKMPDKPSYTVEGDHNISRFFASLNITKCI